MEKSIQKVVVITTVCMSAFFAYTAHDSYDVEATSNLIADNIAAVAQSAEGTPKLGNGKKWIGYYYEGEYTYNNCVSGDENDYCVKSPAI